MHTGAYSNTICRKEKRKKKKTKFTKTDDELNNRTGFILLAVGGVT